MSQNAPTGQSAQSATSGQAAQSAASAADDCLTSPKATAPDGQHWYYRLERDTKRKCWYLREEGAKVAKSAQSTAPVQKPDTPARSVQDARAEFTQQQPAPAPETTGSIPASAAAMTPPPETPRSAVVADAGAQQPAVAARWPDASNAAPAPAPQPAPETVVADTQPAPSPAASPAPVTVATANILPVDKPTGSLPTLLLVIAGALALAGITGSAIYRFASVRVKTHEGRRRVNWDNREQRRDNAHAPWADAPGAFAQRPERPSRAEAPRPVDFGLALAAAANARSATETPANRIEAKTIEPEDTAAQHEDTEFELDDEAVERQLEVIDTIVDETTDPGLDSVEIDHITAMLERLLSEGPRLNQPTSEAGSADFAQTRRGQSAARA
ncbi:hypothetical protein [Bradyrhizobium iriomotense]|uniref:hypothetical protein n=1 Tax=Bradyrhizobium iriomotense TaxID=441950 RepID=UPI0032AF912A